jgi:phospholipid/cholesterol/gamma-HCH transport system ATP-binding protein
MSETVIGFRGVAKAFGEKVVLDDFALDVRAGETLSILGGSGTGKSVTLKLALGLMRVDAGRVEVHGRDVTQLPEKEWIAVRSRFGMVFQGAALFDSLSVFENVAYPLREHSKLSEAETRSRVKERLEWVGLEGVEDLLPAELSGGMRKRVAVARAVALDPEVILYDEPTTGLDPANSRRIGALIRSLQQRLSVTSVVVTHDLELCFAVSDRVGLLHRGRLVQLDAPEVLRSRPVPEVSEFLGSAPVAPS